MKFLFNMKTRYIELPVAVKATVWFFVCSILQKAVSLITVPIFTRIMSTEEYGIFNSYQTWLNFFMIFTTFKLNYGVFNKGMTDYSKNKDEYTSTMMTITSFLGMIFLAIYLIFHNLFNGLTELSTPIMLLMSIELIFEPNISFWSLRERYDFRYKSVVIVTLLLTFINAIFGVIAVIVSSHKDEARIISSAFIYIIFGLIILVFTLKKVVRPFNKGMAKFALAFNFPLIPHYMSEYVLDQSDRIMIQKMCSETELGLYSVVYSAGFVMKVVVTSLNSALVPWLYKKMEKGEFKSIFKVIFKVCMLLYIVLIMFLLVAPEFLKVFASSQYYSAIYVIPPVTISVFFVFLFGIYGNIEFFWDENKFTMYISIIAAALNIILNYIFIPKLGYIVAAYTTLICYIILSFSHMIFAEYISKKKIGYDIMKEKLLWLITIIFVVVSIAINALYEYMLIRYLILTGIFLFGFFMKKQIKELLGNIKG